MVDIQYAAAEIRRGKKERNKKKDRNTGQEYNILHRAAIIMMFCFEQGVPSCRNNNKWSK